MEAANNRLTYVTKFCYGVGHVFNDLCSSMWFSYLLIFFQKVLGFSQTHSGLILLVGQLADGISTPFVGIFSDKENKIAACARYGRRKVWHLMGTIFVLLSFPFIFSQCVGCQDADERLQMIYYCLFVIIFQFGWASVQISHLALIPELTSKKHNRTELNSIRYAFTVLSSLSVYTIAFLLLDNGDTTSKNNDILNSTTTMISTSTDASNHNICPNDAKDFRNMALFCICTGSFFSAIFHIGVKEPPFSGGKKKIVVQSNGKDVTVNRMKISDWFKEISFYQVAILYMATRLYVNLYQVYIPLYVQDTLNLPKKTIATVPFVMYLAGFIGSLVMKQVNKLIGRKGAYAAGSLIGLSGCIAVAIDWGDAYDTWGVYCVAAVLGVGGSTVLITSLSVTSDLIGNNVEGGAFVYGFMSLMDKISNGIVVMIIQSACDNETNCDPKFYQHVITYACGSACLLGFIMILTLIPVKIGKRRGVAKSIASLFSNEEEQQDALKKLQSIYNGAVGPSVITVLDEKSGVFDQKPELNHKQEELNHKPEGNNLPPHIINQINQNIEEGNPKLEVPIYTSEKEIPNHKDPIVKEIPNLEDPIYKSEKEIPNLEDPMYRSKKENTNQDPIYKSKKEIPNQDPIYKSEKEIPNEDPIYKSEKENPNQDPIYKSEKEIPKQEDSIYKSEKEIPNQDPIYKSEKEIPNQEDSVSDPVEKYPNLKDPIHGVDEVEFRAGNSEHSERKNSNVERL